MLMPRLDSHARTLLFICFSLGLVLIFVARSKSEVLLSTQLRHRAVQKALHGGTTANADLLRDGKSTSASSFPPLNCWLNLADPTTPGLATIDKSLRYASAYPQVVQKLNQGELIRRLRSGKIIADRFPRHSHERGQARPPWNLRVSYEPPDFHINQR